MNFREFLEISEFKTQIINVAWMFLGLGYVNFMFHKMAIGYALIFLVAITCFHSGIIMLDNYTDTIKNQGSSNYEQATNIIVADKIPLKSVKNVTFAIIGFGIVVGLILAFLTGPVVLALGILGYILGFCYSNGPFPINRMPIAELVISFAIGFLNVFTYAYVILRQLNINVDLNQLVINLLWTCLPAPILLTLLSLLANNLSDVKQDIQNGRHTLVYYFGTAKSGKLIEAIYWLSPILIVAGVIIGKLPLPTLITVALFPILFKGILAFVDKPDKAKTFPLIVKIVTIILLVYIFTYFAGSFMSMHI